MIFEGTKKSIFFGLGLTRAGSPIPDTITKKNGRLPSKNIFLPISYHGIPIPGVLRKSPVSTEKMGNISKKELSGLKKKQRRWKRQHSAIMLYRFMIILRKMKPVT